ncbi:MAG TPA: sugar ABC transporter ATP-binding protein [Bradyrhizobium sp.]|nr:sugar ABC transporter ATP-binding protein [Bradyrhizobium sp.]
MSEPVLRAEGVTKSFAGVRVLDDVSIEVCAREVVGVVGENGAGKSTLLMMLAGLCRPDCGRIVLRGKTIRLGRISDAAAAGIGMVCQEPSLLPNLSVAENILLGHEDAALRVGVFYDWDALHALAKAQLERLGLGILPSAQTDTLSFAERQMVEMAKVLAIEERTQQEPLILLDEVTSMLDADQTETVLTQLESLRNRASIVFVSHRLDEVLRLCDRIYIMRDGRCVAQRNRGCADIADLQQLMLVRDRVGEYGNRAAPAPKREASVSLSVRAISRANSYQSVSFELRAGEVLGIAGGRRSGHESLCRTLFGAEKPDSGEIVLDGRSVSFADPADAVRLGIGYVPAERSAEGIVDRLSVRKNMTLAHLDGLCRGPVIDFRRERQLVIRWIERLHIKLRSADAPAYHLSGGNQQKLVLAKWLIARTPKILILDHPLRGIDAGTRVEITSLIHDLAQRGVSIVLIADTLDELIALSDRIIVMKDGAVCGSFPALSPGKPSVRQILEVMV